MNRHKNVKSANFCREGTPSMDIVLAKGPVHISLFTDFIERYAKKLSEIELEQVILILSRDKEAMLKQHDFPLIFEEMLSDLIEVQRKRYGVRANEAPKPISLCNPDTSRMRALFKDYFNAKAVNIISIDVRINRYKEGWRDLVIDMQILDGK